MPRMFTTSHYPLDNNAENIDGVTSTVNNECAFNNNKGDWGVSNEDDDSWNITQTTINNIEIIDKSNNTTISTGNELDKKRMIDDQITTQRMISHQKFLKHKSDNVIKPANNDTIGNSINNKNNKHPWKHGTCVIVGGSTILGLNEKRMGDKFKVRGFSGAVVQDMYHYLHPLLEKKPTFVILMVGTNDAPHKNAEQILVELLKLKQHIEDTLPQCQVIISCPTLRNDRANPQAHKVVFDLRKKLINLKIPIILNDNINEEHIGKDGLHLNTYGFGKLAMNYIRYMRKR